MMKRSGRWQHLLSKFGFSMHIGANEVRPKEIQKLLGKVEGTPQEALISDLRCALMNKPDIRRRTPDILDWQRIIIHILHHRFVVTRIFRSIGSSKITCGDV